MIEKLALKHSTWKKYAYKICGDSYLSDDLVSEMYLKLCNEQKEINDRYVYVAIKHIYINWIKSEKKYTELSENYIHEDEAYKEINLELPNSLTWVEKQVLLLRQKMSCREIEKQYHINSTKIYRIEKIAKEKAKEWAKKQFQELVMQ